MVTILLSLCMFVLLVVSGLMTVIILMQKPSANAGMGAALGGGAAESVFGGEASGALLKFTVRISVVYFVISFLLYMGFVMANRPSASAVESLPSLGLPATPAAPAVPASGTSASTTSTPAASTPMTPAATTTSTPATTPAAAPKAASSAASSSSK